MSQTREPVPVPQKQQRDNTIRALCDHFAADRLTVEEFERRLDVANRTQSSPELNALLADLPALAQPAPQPMKAAPVVPSEHRRDHQVLAAVMGGVERAGAWQPARKTLLYTFWGGAGLDFRDVQLPPGETEVTVMCIMGGAEIIVPPGMRVDSNGIAVMGAFEHIESHPVTAESDTPLLRINGFALMGAVEVLVRRPGETAGDAKRRQREERGRLKEQWRRER